MSLDNVRYRQILPVLNRCAVCKKAPHSANGHEYVRDETMPKWHGWHAFRRALATDLHSSGAAVKVAQGALRHADPALTLRVYTKIVAEDVRAAIEERDRRLELSLQDTSGTPARSESEKAESVN